MQVLRTSATRAATYVTLMVALASSPFGGATCTPMFRWHAGLRRAPTIQSGQLVSDCSWPMLAAMQARALRSTYRPGGFFLLRYLIAD